MSRIVFLAGIALIFRLAVVGGERDDSLSAYEAGDYKAAIPLLRAAAAAKPDDAAHQAALLSALVYEDAVDEASDLADADAEKFPNSAEVLAARGDFAFYMGDLGAAEKLWVAAANQENARAYYGLYRLNRAASNYRTARLRCLKAHAIDPDDALITKAWLTLIPAQKRAELLPAFAAAHPWLYRRYEVLRQTGEAVEHEVNSRKPFELEGETKEEDVRLFELHDSPSFVRGVGIEFAINGGHRMHLLLDTGASGILLKQAAIDKAGLEHLGSTEAWGVGDKGVRSGFVSVADECQIGGLKYKTCVVEALDGKHQLGTGEDGLIGMDVFSAYLIHIDFQRHEMHLTPLPSRPPNPQGYDRETGQDRVGFTRAYRFGHQLMVSTRVNEKTTGLFLIDTGSTNSIIDSAFARLSTKIHGNEYQHIRGISGSVKDVFEADKALIEFSVFRQRNFGLTSFNLNNSPNHQDVRMDGILGLPMLSLFRLTLDYRNGLVKFDYVLK